MKQEDKDLLLKDLCARLPYNTMIYGIYTYKEFYYMAESEQIVFDENDSVLTASDIEWIEMDAAEIKPYLFPLSSVTEDQAKELFDLFNISIFDLIGNDYIKINKCTGITFFLNRGFDVETHLDKLFNWLNTYHFDYRGLIEKGLAIDATNLNIY